MVRCDQASVAKEGHLFSSHPHLVNIVSEQDLPDTLVPDVLVEPGVDPDVLGSHLLLSKLLDLLDSPGRLVLEPDSMQPLVHVDRVLAGNDL